MIAANDELKKKVISIAELSKQISNQHEDIKNLREIISCKDDAIKQKDSRIAELENERNNCEKANTALKASYDESLEKISVLKDEIQTIVKGQDEEMNKLIQKKINLDGKCEKLTNKNQSMLEESMVLKNDLKLLNGELEKKEAEYRRILDENIQLLDGIERIKKQADEDMLSYAIESKKLTAELDTAKQEKSKIITELCLKEELLNALQEEIAGKAADMDAERDELKQAMNAELKTITKKYEQQIATLKEVNDMKVKEVESISVLERAQLLKEHKVIMASLSKANEKERARCNDSAEQKIRIAELQNEQKIKEFEAVLEQSVQLEKNIWKSEIEKCQKIAEREIIQCEFEKQDLKRRLELANEKISDMVNQPNNVKVANLIRNRDDLESELKMMQQERGHFLTERYNYQMALKNTRSTVNVLMDRLQKSDSDVEMLKAELDATIQSNLVMGKENNKLTQDIEDLTKEIEEYRFALTALRNSSLALELEVLEKESVFEKIMSSEQETLETVNKIGKLFNDKLEENMSKYADLYNEMRKKYDSREIYIKDMKALLEEFATGIELARLELDMKDKQLSELQDENKNIKLENMTYKFKCEQFERYTQGRCESVEKLPTENAIGTGLSMGSIEKNIVRMENNTETFSDEDKITAENLQLREKLSEKIRQIEFLQELVEVDNGHAVENHALRHQINELEQKVALIEKFTSEKMDKYSELIDHQQRQQMDQLMEKNVYLKNVSKTCRKLQTITRRCVKVFLQPKSLYLYNKFKPF